MNTLQIKKRINNNSQQRMEREKMLFWANGDIAILVFPVGIIVQQSNEQTVPETQTFGNSNSSHAHSVYVFFDDDFKHSHARARE